MLIFIIHAYFHNYENESNIYEVENSMLNIYEWLNYLNRNSRDNTYSKIIIYLLSHPKEVEHLTISQIANKCFVSPATMTRFCQSFGIASFSQLRESLSTFVTMKSHSSLRMKEKELFELKKDPKTFLLSYEEEIHQAMTDVIQTINIEAIDQLLEAIHQAKEVILIGYSSTLELAKDIQTAFISNQKLLFVAETEEIQQSLVKQLSKDSMVLVISSYGTLLNKNTDLINEISNSPAMSVLFTQHTQNILTNLFDEAINVTTTNYVRIGNYPLNFFFDYFVRRYASLYN